MNDRASDGGKTIQTVYSPQISSNTKGSHLTSKEATKCSGLSWIIMWSVCTDWNFGLDSNVKTGLKQPTIHKYISDKLNSTNPVYNCKQFETTCSTPKLGSGSFTQLWWWPDIKYEGYKWEHENNTLGQLLGSKKLLSFHELHHNKLSPNNDSDQISCLYTRYVTMVIDNKNMFGTWFPLWADHQ